MTKNRIFDCITFFDENLLTNLRFEILNKVVDFFIVCESKYDHKGNPKKINFSLLNNKFKNKVKHIVISDQFPDISNGWGCESFQREKIFDGLNDALPDDYILYSDSDEIPNPKKLENFILKNKYGIFMQKFFVYKLNIFNGYETPWEGSRICKRKDLRSFTYLRKKILKKNISKPFWKFNIEKKIDIINEGGWHFNNLYPTEIISKKLKVFPHKEFAAEKYSNISVIEKKISNLEDLFERGHKYQKEIIDESYPEFILKHKEQYKNYIL